MTVTAAPEEPAAKAGVRLPRWAPPAAGLVVFAACYLAFRGQDTLPHDGEAPLFQWLTEARDWVEDNRNSSPIFVFFVNYITIGFDQLYTGLEALLRALGWPGVITGAGAIGWVASGWRLGLGAAAGFAAFGLLGFWEESVETLAATVTAVAVSLIIGVPLGIWAGRSDRFQRLITPVLDTMQIMPAFCYLAPLALVFAIGPPAAAIATMIYAMPPAIRITALAIRRVPAETVEAARSMGSTALQTLAKVQLPMARTTLALAVNQTIMMALSMVVITALIDAPGLGKNIVRAVERVQVGPGLLAGAAVVIMAIVLDRLTRARTPPKGPPGLTPSHSPHPPPSTAPPAAQAPARRLQWKWLGAVALAAGGVIAGLALPAEFPEGWELPLSAPINNAAGWLETNLFGVTTAIKNGVTYGLLIPLESVFTNAAWWLMIAAVLTFGWRVRGWRAALTAVACLLIIAAMGLWQHAMITLSMVLVAAGLTVLLGVALGIAAARSDGFAAVQRPMLDAAQTMPVFVYLIIVLALFTPSRFTAIAAAVIYAIAPVVRLVEEGIRGVPAAVVEAAESAGSTPRQLLWKVQLPIARRSLLLAINQGMIMVLAMVVVGGMVGGGALGYDVVHGFVKTDAFGLGLAAGIAIVLLGIALDRITQGAKR